MGNRTARCARERCAPSEDSHDRGWQMADQADERIDEGNEGEGSVAHELAVLSMVRLWKGSRAGGRWGGARLTKLGGSGPCGVFIRVPPARATGVRPEPPQLKLRGQN